MQQEIEKEMEITLSLQMEVCKKAAGTLEKLFYKTMEMIEHC